MSSNFFEKLILKIFNKRKYNQIKNKENIRRNIEFYNSHIKHKIEKISEILNSKSKLNFVHSGHLGDIIYSLPVVKELSKKYTCNYYLRINKKLPYYHPGHPAGNILLTKKSAEMLLPLLRKQKFINEVKIFNNENIDIDLDLFRDIPINLNFHSIRWYSHLTGTSLDMNRNYLEVGTNQEFNDKIVIVRTERYRSPYINYKFLNSSKNLLHIGLKSEFDELKKEINGLEFHDCKDFLEMAEIVNSAKLFVGNLNFVYSLSEALKTPRLLEASTDFPVVFPLGEKAFDSYHQVHFEKFFTKLSKSP